MARPDLGNKRACGECGAKFYDLNKHPIVCPKCGTVFDVATAAPAGRAKPQKAAEPKPAVEKDETEVEDDENLVPLEDADAEEADTGRAGTDEESDDDIPDIDEEVEDDGDTEDEFLEEDDEDNDVSGLIDNDIEEDRD